MVYLFLFIVLVGIIGLVGWMIAVHFKMVYLFLFIVLIGFIAFCCWASKSDVRDSFMYWEDDCEDDQD